MSATEHTRAFADAVLGGREAALTGSFITLWTYPDRLTQWRPASEPDALVSSVEQLSADENVQAVYMGLALQAERGDPKRRGKVSRTSGLLALGGDIDILEPDGPQDVHDTRHGKAYPPDRAAARRIVASMELPPTVVVDSGYGLQAWWVFTEPWIFGQTDVDDDGVPVIDADRVDADRTAAGDLWWSWTTTMRLRARSIGGWHVDPIGDLARVLRVPGSLNNKVAGVPRPVTVVHADPNATYGVDDFTPYLAEAKLLEGMRAGGEVTEGALAGVDVHAVWVRSTSSEYKRRKYLPEWLETVIEIDREFGAGRIGDTFNGRVKEHGGDGSTIDAALVRLLADVDVDAEGICEAIMCRRMRSGEKTHKVDPRQRLDYLQRTVGRFLATSRAAAAKRAADTKTASTVLDDATATEPAPSSSEQATPAPTGENAQPWVDDAADAIIDQPPTAAESVAEPRDRPPGSPKEAPGWDRVDELTGEQMSAPPRPTPAERAACSSLTVQLGLPAGFAVWRVEWRRGQKVDDIRMWIYRSEDTEPVNGREDWKAGTAVATRWHPKSYWEKGAEVAGFVRRDCHVMVGLPTKKWASDAVPVIYSIFHEVKVGTARAAIVAAARDLLLNFAPLERFLEARDHGHPWLMSDRDSRVPPTVAVSASVLRRHLLQMGEWSSLAPEDLLTMLSAMGCVVHSGIATTDEVQGRVVDSRTWVVIAPGLLTSDDWASVRAAVAAYIEQRNSANVTPMRGWRGSGPNGAAVNQ